MFSTTTRLLAISAMAIAPTTSSGQQHRLTYREVKALARDAIQNSQVEYAPPTVEMDRSNRRIKVTWGNFWFEPQTPVSAIVGRQAQLERFRTAYGRGLDRRFWEPLVVQAEGVVEKTMLPIAYNAQLSHEQKWSELEKAIQKSKRVFNDGLERYAAGNGYVLEVPGPEWNAWAVTVRTEPRGGEVRMCHILDYIVAIKEKRDPNQMLQIQVEGSPITWSGIHMVKATFLDSKAYGPKELSVKQAGELVIYPDRSPKLIPVE